MFIKRTHYLQKIEKEFEIHPIVGLLGPRQCGKTTLAKRFQAKHKPAYLFDLEDPDDLAALENPKMVLESLDGLIIIDEIQRRPGLFPYLRTLADKKKTQNTDRTEHKQNLKHKRLYLCSVHVWVLCFICASRILLYFLMK